MKTDRRDYRERYANDIRLRAMKENYYRDHRDRVLERQRQRWINRTRNDELEIKVAREWHVSIERAREMISIGRFPP